MNNGRTTLSELLKHESIVAEKTGGMFRGSERRDLAGLGIMGRWSGYGIPLVRGWGIPTVFPMMRTGSLSFAGLHVGRCSTERTGHLYEE